MRGNVNCWRQRALVYRVHAVGRVVAARDRGPAGIQETREDAGSVLAAVEVLGRVQEGIVYGVHTAGGVVCAKTFIHRSIVH